MKRMKQLLSFALCLLLVIGLFPAQASAGAKKAVRSVTISNVTTSTLVLNPRQTYKLKTTVKVTGKASKKVTYTLSLIHI